MERPLTFPRMQSAQGWPWGVVQEGSPEAHLNLVDGVHGESNVSPGLGIQRGTKAHWPWIAKERGGSLLGSKGNALA
jgi:hypothetical protein